MPLDQQIQRPSATISAESTTERMNYGEPARIRGPDRH